MDRLAHVVGDDQATNAIVDQLDSKDIGQKENDLVLGVVAFWGGYITASTTDYLFGP